MRTIYTILSLLFILSISANADVLTGKAGEHVEYEFNTETGELHIYGTGDMYDRGGNWNYGYGGTSPIADYRTTRNGRSGIKTVVIDEGVTSIGAAFFYLCSELTSISMPSSLKVIGNEAFRGCTKLQTVTIPAGVTDVRDRSFTDCSKLEYIYVDSKNKSYVSVEGVLYTSDLTKIVRFPEGLNTMDYVIPEGVNSAATDALYKLGYVESITIPQSMKRIDYGSFDQSPRLKSLVFQSSTPPVFGKNDIPGLNLEAVYVPCGAEASYKASSWGGFKIEGAMKASLVVDFHVFTNDKELGDVRITGRAECDSRTIKFQAIANPGGTFDHWQDGSVTNPRSVEIPVADYSRYEYTAYFVPRKYSLTVAKGTTELGSRKNRVDVKDYYQVSASDGGSPEKKIQTTGTELSKTGSDFRYGDQITLYCNVTKSGYKFSKWSDGNTDNPRVIRLTEDAKTYTASIEAGQVTIKTVSDNINYGTTDPPESTMSFGEDVTIKAIPKSGYKFLRWDDGDTNSVRTVTATGDKTYKAYFGIETFTVNVTVNDDVMGTVTGYGTFNRGTSVTLNAIPNTGYEFVNWSGDITGTTVTKNVTSNLTRDYDIVATFAPINYYIEFDDEEGEEIQGTYVAYNTMPTPPTPPVKPSTDEFDYPFNGWSPEVEKVTGEQTYIVTYLPVKRQYNIKFVNSNGDILQSSDVEYGVMPQYTGSTPTKAATAEFSYTFKGWDKTIATVTGAATYTATYTETKNKYTISFVDENGTTKLCADQTIEYGSMPSKPANPTKTGNNQYEYTFAGWTPEVTTVTGPKTYKATYTSKLKQYTIKFIDGDGNIIGEPLTLAYGAKVEYNGTTPTKTATDKYGYTFKGWDKTFANVSKDETYTAQFDSFIREYTITFKNYDGTVLQSTKVKYDVTPSYAGATPIKPASASVKYKFNGWSPAIVKVAGDATYTAQFVDGDAVLYDITFIINEKETKVVKFAYNTKAKYDGTPVKPSTVDKVFTFKGWSPELTNVTANKTYTAVYTETPRPYTITFVNEDGVTELQKSNVPYGTMPVLPTEPTKKGNAEYTYTFSKWTPDVVKVVGDAKYTAVFAATKNKYLVKFVDFDNKLIKSQEVEYGKSATAPANPTRTGYTFDKWIGSYTNITEAKTITASYKINKYKIIFNNWDNTKLDEQTVEYGVKPSYAGKPTKPSDAQYTYVFKGWDKEIVEATANVTYTATFDSQINSYTVTFTDEDGKTPLQTLTVNYGDMPKYTKAEPSKAATAKYTYYFDGWEPKVVSVTGNASYKAKFREEINEYEITFVNWDGSALKNGVAKWKYDEMPVYSGTPTRPATAQYTYTHNGWSPVISAVTGKQTYKAQYKADVNNYDVTFVNWDGTKLATISVPYGSAAKYEGDEPKRPSDATKNYTFVGWSPDINTPITGNKTYTAQYSDAAIIYTITLVDYDDKVLDSKKVAAGELIANTLVPTREANANFTYTFAGWEPELTATTKATGNMTFKAKYDSQWRSYDVRFEMDNHDEIVTLSVKYGDMPVEPTNVVKAETDQYTYTFNGWNKEIKSVTEETIYTAVFTPVLRKYFIKFVDYDNSELQYSEYEYGVKPTCKVPTRKADAQYTYTFNTWEPAIVEVNGEASYKATYNKTVNQYTVTFKNEDGTVLSSTKYNYGDKPSYEGTPSKSSTDEWQYTFNGWNKEIVDVVADAEYVATYSETKRSYVITFVDYDGTVLQKNTLEYGAIPAVTIDEPKRPSDGKVTYTFKGWSPTITSVVGETTYYAEYSSADIIYTISFVDYDDTPLFSTKFEAGEQIVCGIVPMRVATESHTYSFVGWDPELSEDMVATCDQTFKAKYSENLRSYNIRFVMDNGDEIQSSSVAYGEMPTEPTGIVKAADESFTYTFNGWDKEIVAVTGEAIYTATFISTAIETDPTDPKDPNNPINPEDPVNPEEPTKPIEDDPESPCYKVAPSVALYDWLLMIDKKSMRQMGLDVKDENVTWYRIVGDRDDECDSKVKDDEVVGLGLYYTSEYNLIGTGSYYAVVALDGVLYRTQVFDYSKANKTMILPSRATPNQKLRVTGIDGEATIMVYDMYGRMVRMVHTDGASNYDIDAESTAGMYIVRIMDAQGSVLKYVVR